MAGSENREGWLVGLQNADRNWNLSIQLEVCICIVGMWTVCVRLCEVQFQRKHLFLKSSLFVWKIELAAAEFADKKFTLFKDCISKLPCLLSPPLWLAWSSPLLARHGPQVCSICLNDPYWRAWNDFEQLKIFFSDAWTTQEQTRYKDKHQTVLQSPRKPRAFQEDDHAMWVAKAHPKQFSTFCNLFSFWTLNRRSFPEHIKWFFTTNNNNTKTRIMTSAIWNIYKMYCGIDFYQLLLRQLSFVKNCSAKHCRKQGWI